MKKYFRILTIFLLSLTLSSCSCLSNNKFKKDVYYDETEKYGKLSESTSSKYFSQDKHEEEERRKSHTRTRTSGVSPDNATDTCIVWIIGVVISFVSYFAF